MAFNIGTHYFICSACGGTDNGCFNGWQPAFCPMCGRKIQERRVDARQYAWVWQDWNAQETRVSHDGETWYMLDGGR